MVSAAQAADPDTDRGHSPNPGTSKFSGRANRTIAVPAAVAGADTWALVTNTTAVLPTLASQLTLWPDVHGPQRTVSNLNAAKGQIVANATITDAPDIGTGNMFNIYNDQGAVNVVVDFVCSMECKPST